MDIATDKPTTENVNDKKIENQETKFSCFRVRMSYSQKVISKYFNFLPSFVKMWHTSFEFSVF